MKLVWNARENNIELNYKKFIIIQIKIIIITLGLYFKRHGAVRTKKNDEILPKRTVVFDDDYNKNEGPKTPHV